MGSMIAGKKFLYFLPQKRKAGEKYLNFKIVVIK